VLTVDLAPGTDRLWNRSLGHEVDSDDHGTVDDLLHEAAEARLEVAHSRNCPIGAAEVDVVGFVFRRA
jgi:hypothetical protein